MRVLDRLARAALARHLAPLSGGQVHFEDELGHWSVGSAEEADGLSTRIHVRDLSFYRDIVLGGTVAASQAYLSGAWECDDLTTLFRIILKDGTIADRTDNRFGRITSVIAWLQQRFRPNTRGRSRSNIAAHYDLGNDFFALFLDESMTYSCGIFTHAASSLEQAQVEKLDRVCKRLGLVAGDRVLEIGGGWGSFARHAASQYGCHVTTTTISREQYEFTRERIRREGLEGQVRVLLQDYRDLQGHYDKIVSIEMIEAIGHEQVGPFLRKVSSLLTGRGAALVQCITLAEDAYERYHRSIDFIQKHVFPGSCLLSMNHLEHEAERTGDLRIESVEDIGPHYVGTLRAWRDRFQRRLDDVQRLGRDERFVRLWNYYLTYCEAGFRERFLGDVQLVLAKPRWHGGQLAPIPASPW